MQMCSVPRAALPGLDLQGFVVQHSRPVRLARLRPAGWDLEGGRVSDLLEKIKRAGVPLRDYIGSSPLYGVKTGFNEAFLIDQATRDRLVAEDPNCEPIIKKYLRGRDIQRWHPQWAGQWMIFARRGIEIDHYPSIKRHLLRFRRQLEPRPVSWASRKQGQWPGRKAGAYKWYELQDTIDYFERLEEPKILYQDLAFHSWIALDNDGMYANNTCYFVPGADLYLLGILNSSVVWWYLSRNTTHAKDEAFRLHGIFMEELPVVKPKDTARRRIEDLGRNLADLTGQRQEVNACFLSWIETHLGTVRVTRRMDTYWELDPPTLLSEMKRAGAKLLTPVVRQALLEEHRRQVAELRPILARMRQLEIELQHQVFDLYGLTPDEVRLLRATAPPRDPLALVEALGADGIEPGAAAGDSRAHDGARSEPDRDGDSPLAGGASRRGVAPRRVPAQRAAAGRGVDGLRRGAGGAGDPGGASEDPGRRGIASTRYLDTLAGPRSYAELAPDLGRAVEEVCAALAQSAPDRLVVTREWLCGLHGEAFGRFVDWAGRLRDRDVQIGDHLAPPAHALPGLLHDYCADLEARLATHGQAQPIERLIGDLAFAEGRFLYIHPFRDFNGRVARLLLFALLVRLQLPPVALLPQGDAARRRYLAALAAADANDYRGLEAIWAERLAAAPDPQAG